MQAVLELFFCPGRRMSDFHTTLVTVNVSRTTEEHRIKKTGHIMSGRNENF